MNFRFCKFEWTFLQLLYYVKKIIYTDVKQAYF